MLEQDHIPIWNKLPYQDSKPVSTNAVTWNHSFNNWPFTMNKKSSVDFRKIYCNLKNYKISDSAVKLSCLIKNIIPEEGGQKTGHRNVE